MWAIGRLLLFGDSVPRSGWGFQHQERAAGWNREHRERDRLVEGLREGCEGFVRVGGWLCEVCEICDSFWRAM